MPDPLEIRLCPGADGSFVLYEDAGDGFEFEKGARSEIPLTWNDKARELVIGERKGSFDSMLKTRKVRVALVRDGVGGIEPLTKVDYEGVYEGKSMRIHLK